MRPFPSLRGQRAHKPDRAWPLPSCWETLAAAAILKQVPTLLWGLDQGPPTIALTAPQEAGGPRPVLQPAGARGLPAPGLRHLTLHHNSIERIPATCSRMKPGLETLHLAHNSPRETASTACPFWACRPPWLS